MKDASFVVMYSPVKMQQRLARISGALNDAFPKDNVSPRVVFHRTEEVGYESLLELILETVIEIHNQRDNNLSVLHLACTEMKQGREDGSTVDFAAAVHRAEVTLGKIRATAQASDDALCLRGILEEMGLA